jgi:hypothetical protein
LDVVVASLNDSKLWKFDDPAFSFKKALTQTLKAAQGAFSYTYGDWQAEGRDESCGKNRTIFITITNLNQPQTETTVARVLQAIPPTMRGAANAVTNIGVKFSNTDFSAKLVSGVATFVALALTMLNY